MATFTVTNLFDSGAGSLRDAIFQANTATTTDIIDFDTSLSGGTVSLSSGGLRITDDLTIDGLGADFLSIDADDNPFRVFVVSDGDENSFIDVTMNGLTITGGNALGDPFSPGVGGGIINRENLTVTNSTISGNEANYGGGIGNYGGSIGNYSTLTVINSTISGNEAGYYGGGIENSFYGNLTVTNSTISGNEAVEYGGGINNFGDLTVTNSTISGNEADFGGGIYSYFGISTIVTSSIIADNNEDIRGTSFTSGGNNLIGNGDGAGGFTNGVNGDIVGTTSNPIDPLLGELQDNGGPTQTQALLSGSPAINAGSNPLNLEFDQRGPGFDRVVGAQTDIGAYEVVPEPDSTLGVLGVAILGAVLVRKRQRPKKTKA